MSFRKADGPLAVQVPSPAADRPSWLGVGTIAAAGFLIGVAWPRLAGLRPGASVPDGASASVCGAVRPEASGVSSVSAPVVLTAPRAAVAPPAAAAATAAGGVRVSVARGTVFACKTPSGDSLKGNECGTLPGLDALVQPRLRKLSDCPEAAATNGKLRLVVRADFGRGALTVDLGREHGVATAEPLLACAKSALGSVTLEGIAHENARYSVAYGVTFAPPSAPAAAPVTAPEADAPAVARAAPEVGDGTALVEWEVAIVRDTPKTGKVVARLPRGTPLRVGAAKDGWYPAKYGDGFASDGWVYRGAIGR